MFNLNNSPYNIEQEAESQIIRKISDLEERMTLLRESGAISSDTLRDYFGEKRFEQVAESNAIEGSTLSVGETELAILKGVTVTGHDPAYVRDAQALNEALNRLYEIATFNQRPTDITQLLELHSIIMSDRDGAGAFRRERVRISGAEHTPPKDPDDVVEGMAEWQNWSLETKDLSPVIRAIVLHTWLTHIHPFLDGNGRTARAIVTLELVRGGYPVPIIRRKERKRYIDSLAESDQGGDLRSITELFLERIDGALTGMENSARTVEGYDLELERIQRQYEAQLKIWKGGLEILLGSLKSKLEIISNSNNLTYSIKEYDFPLEVEELTMLMQNRAVSGSWLFVINVSLPGRNSVTRLAWAGYRSKSIRQLLSDEGGPTILFSRVNPDPHGYPKWIQIGEREKFLQEVTCSLSEGSEWAFKREDGNTEKGTVIDVSNEIIRGLLANVED